MIRALALIPVCTLAIVPLAAQDPAPTPLWSLSGEFQSPESAFYDEATNTVFVSNINGDLTAKDGNGYISRLSPDGKVLEARWATGLNGPKGIRGLGGTLYAADIDEVVAIDIATGKIVSRTPVPGATFLNDLATAPDGRVFVSDSFGPRVYVVKDGKASVFVEGDDQIGQVNGLLVDGNRLITGSIGAGGGRGRGAGRGGQGAQAAPPANAPPAQGGARAAGGAPPAGGQQGRGGGRGGFGGGGALYAFDLTTRARTQLTTDNVGGVDGIEPDGRGGVLLTDVFGRRIVHVSAGQARTVLQLAGGGADFGYNPSRRIAFVPFLNEHKVEAYDLSAALK